MLDIKAIKDLYKKYNVSASKSFGQNFLISQSIVNKIIEASNISNKDVIEIGPGLGSLTLELLLHVKTLTAYELDKDMIKVLYGEIDNPKFTLLEGDFTKSTFDWDGKKIAIGNIPYNITTNILFHIFNNYEKFSSITLMVQDEYAKRISAKVSTSDYGKLSLTTQLFTDSIEYITKVEPTNFIPQPKVNSAVIKLSITTRKVDKDLIIFIKNIFAMRRKTLVNNLKRMNYKMESIKEVFSKLNFKPTIRPQELTLNNVKKLFQILK